MTDIKIYVDWNVKTDFPMSRSLRELIDECDEYAKKNDWYFYMVRRDEIDATSKAALQNHAITQEQFNMIMKKYALR